MSYFDKTKTKIVIEDSLPHNFLAEKMVLSCILSNPDAIELTSQSLSIEAFYFKNHQELYRILLQMNTNLSPIDVVTVTAFIQDNGLLANIGGIKVLLDLANTVPTVSYLSEYIRIVKEKFLKRCLIRFGYKIINYGYITNQSLETMLAEIETELFELTNEIKSNKIVPLAQILNDVFSELKEKFLNPQLTGLSSGFVELDKLTQGFQKSDLIIIAGRPSMGKTAFSINLALNCLKFSRLPVLFCSLEMSKEQIVSRFLSSETGINPTKLKNGQLTETDWIKLSKIMRIVAKLPFFIDDTSNLSVQEIRSKIKAIMLEQTKLGLVVIDYLQLMQSLEFKSGNRVQELSQITRYLKNLSKEFQVPIIALSQLSRNVDTRIDQRPILSDLRESGSIEQDADVVIMLYRPKSNYVSNYSQQTSGSNPIATELIIVKQRNGPTGTIKLKFNQSRMLFTDFET